MLAIVFIGLLISLLVVFAFVAYAFLEAAFIRPRCDLEFVKRFRQWQPPFLRGDDLFAWAVTTAKAATTRLVANRTPDVAKQLAADIYEGATLAIAQSPSALSQRKPSCPSCRQQMIGVTPPEALALAEAVRKTKPKSEANRIRDRAAHNATKVIDLNHEQYERSRVLCPLLASDGSCAAFDVRPLHCRGWCRFCGSEENDSLSSPGDAVLWDEHARTVGRGAEEGLSQALESSGLDGKIYELNSALVAALDTPTAAEQWASGTLIFAGCKRYE